MIEEKVNSGTGDSMPWSPLSLADPHEICTNYCLLCEVKPFTPFTAPLSTFPQPISQIGLPEQILHTGCLKQWKCTFHSLGSWKSKIKVQAGWCLLSPLPLACIWLPSCDLTWPFLLCMCVSQYPLLISSCVRVYPHNPF